MFAVSTSKLTSSEFQLHFQTSLYSIVGYSLGLRVDIAIWWMLSCISVVVNGRWSFGVTWFSFDIFQSGCLRTLFATALLVVISGSTPDFDITYLTWLLLFWIWDSIYKKTVDQKISVEDIRDVAQVWFITLLIVVVEVGFCLWWFATLWSDEKCKTDWWFVNLTLVDVGAPCCSWELFWN